MTKDEKGNNLLRLVYDADPKPAEPTNIQELYDRLAEGVEHLNKTVERIVKGVLVQNDTIEKLVTNHPKADIDEKLDQIIDRISDLETTQVTNQVDDEDWQKKYGTNDRDEDIPGLDNWDI